MLRESGKAIGSEIDIEVVVNGDSGQETIPGQRVLLILTEAIHSWDPKAIESARQVVVDELGPEAAVDACGVAAAFFGFDLVADATGCQVANGVVEARLDVHRVLGLQAPTRDG